MQQEFSNAAQDPTRPWQDCISEDRKTEVFGFVYKAALSTRLISQPRSGVEPNIEAFGIYFSNERMSQLILCLAAQPSHPENLDTLLAYGIHVDTREPQGKSHTDIWQLEPALGCAVGEWLTSFDEDDDPKSFTAQALIIDKLLSHGANPNFMDSAFHILAKTCGESEGHRVLLGKLIGAGANVNVQNPLTGETPLMAAVGSGITGSAVHLCSLSEVDLDVRNDEGLTAEDIANNFKREASQRIETLRAMGNRAAATYHEQFLDTLDAFLSSAKARRETGRPQEPCPTRS